MPSSCESMFKQLLTVVAVAAALATTAHASETDLIEPLRPTARQVMQEFSQIPAARAVLLKETAAALRDRSRQGQPVALTFICTHNSRRSHLAQLWAQAAAVCYGLTNVVTYSGGTEVAACNPRTVRALRRAGFSIATATPGTNAVYLAQFAETQPPARLYSKVYSAPENPQRDFFAFFCCDQADASCPTVAGAARRISVPYVDPKLSDGTPEESRTYDERSRQIAREMFFLMAEVRAGL